MLLYSPILRIVLNPQVRIEPPSNGVQNALDNTPGSSTGMYVKPPVPLLLDVVDRDRETKLPHPH